MLDTAFRETLLHSSCGPAASTRIINIAYSLWFLSLMITEIAAFDLGHLRSP